MGKTSTDSKRRYNEKTYDRIALSVRKGEREKIRSHAATQGESINAFINRAITETIARDTEKIPD